MGFSELRATFVFALLEAMAPPFIFTPRTVVGEPVQQRTRHVRRADRPPGGKEFSENATDPRIRIDISTKN